MAAFTSPLATDPNLLTDFPVSVDQIVMRPSISINAAKCRSVLNAIPFRLRSLADIRLHAAGVPNPAHGSSDSLTSSTLSTASSRV